LAGAKPVPAGNMHLTLQFLGEIPESDAKTVSGALAAAVSGVAPFPVRFAGVGAFQSVRRATVLWTGVGEGRDGLVELASRVKAVTGRIVPISPEKPLVPHLTLARFRVPADLSRLELFPEVMQTDLGMCTIDKVSFYSSQLTPAGPIYGELGSYRLKA
jgi:2'-5' RNA ligase